MFDVLPRIKILSNVIDINKIDNYLFPNLEKNYQKQSLDILKDSDRKEIIKFKIKTY